MDTRIYHIDPKNIDMQSIGAAAAVIRRGGLVAFPTETVYGLGADAFCEEAVKNIYKAKGRPSDNPLIVHISDFGMLDMLAAEVPYSAKKLMEAFMPGPVTVIVPKSDRVSDTVTGGLDTVAVRFPSDPAANALIAAARTPIAAPSANLSGKPSPTTAKHVIDDLSGRVDCIIAGGDCEAGVESTVIDTTRAVPVILRPGIITLEDVRSIIPSAEVDKNVAEAVSITDKPRCPGMKYKHYAPDAEVVVVEGGKNAVKREIDRLISENRDKITGVMTCSDNTYDAEVVICAGNTMAEYAHNLFTNLRRFDELGVQLVFAEFRSEGGCALAVKNRLYKAAAHRVIYAD